MEKYIIIGLSIAVAVLLIVVLVLARLNRKLRFGGIKIKDGVRYTTDERIEKDNKTNITYNEKDFILEINKEYTVGGKKNKLLPGTYTALATNDTYTKFNLRVGGLVREYKHGEKIVLNEGDSISAVSHVVILR